jgi:nucleoid DNA-binding protein
MNQTAFLSKMNDVLAEKGWELSKKDVKELVESVGEAVLLQLKEKPPKDKNQVAVVPGLGRFTLRKYPRRKVRIPFGDDAGKMKWVPASKKVRATLAKPLRDAVMKIK